MNPRCQTRQESCRHARIWFACCLIASSCGSGTALSPACGVGLDCEARSLDAEVADLAFVFEDDAAVPLDLAYQDLAPSPPDLSPQGDMAHPLFAQPVEYLLGGKPRTVIASDLNGDKKLDLAVANPAKVDGDIGSLNILLGNGDGSFKPSRSFDAGRSPTQLEAFDANRDGKRDVVLVQEADNRVAVFPGDGTGMFGPPVLYDPGGYPHGLLASDFDRDGVMDVAVMSTTANFNDPASFHVLLGQMNGTFGGAIVSAIDGTRSLTAWAPGDFNGDKVPDVAFINFSANEVAFLPGKGDGSFDAFTATAGKSPYFLTVGDFDRDGRLDLATIREATTEVDFMHGKGDGTFSAPAPLLIDATSLSAISAADVSGDGKLDLLIGVIDNKKAPALAVALGDGKGAFQAPLLFPCNFSINSIVAGDFNGDLRADVAVVGADAGKAAVYLNASG